MILVTVISTPVTLLSISVALLVLHVALTILDCTESAVAVGAWMVTSTKTLPDVTATSTADGWTPASAAIARRISSCTNGVNENMSPASLRVNAMTLIAGVGGDERSTSLRGVLGCCASSRPITSGCGG